MPQQAPPAPLFRSPSCFGRCLPTCLFPQRLEKVAEAGYTNVELVGEYAKWSLADFADANVARKRLGISFDATSGLENAGHAHGLADPAYRDPFLAELKQALTSRWNCFPCLGNDRPFRQRGSRPQCGKPSIRAVFDSLKRAAEVIDGKHIDGQPVRLLLENIDPEENSKYFLQSAAECMDVVRAVNHPQVQFLYDIFHEQVAEGNLLEKLEKNIDLVGLIHIADVPGRHEPGTGEINYARSIANLPS